MALYFDVTKAQSAKQLSGLIRVSHQLRRSLDMLLGLEVVPVSWSARRSCFVNGGGQVMSALSRQDCFLTPEIFTDDDRPGCLEHLEASGMRCAAIFHDAIPLKHPEITWPHSVARHPAYMKGLTRFQHIFAVSEASLKDLLGYWSWLDMPQVPTSTVLALGADFFDGTNADWTHGPQDPPLILNVGILEPRKNQSDLLELAIELWEEGFDFELHFVGRVNPHFGKPIEAAIKKVRKAGRPVTLHTRQTDDSLLKLYARARFTVFNSRAEGFGLPVLESLWLGVPCICNRLPSLESLQLGSACRFTSSKTDLKTAWAEWLGQPKAVDEASQAAGKLKLPLWSEAAETVLNWVKGS